MPVPDPLFRGFGELIADRYRPTRKLSEGGFGEVYAAWHLGVRKFIALKLLRPDADPEAKPRFIAEAHHTAQLDHPNTVSVFDFGVTGAGEMFLAMEMLKGRTLADELKSVQRMDCKRAVRIAKQVLLSLQDAHGRGLIHRDLKPQNIFLCEIAGLTDHVKVIDFGIAKMLGHDSHVKTQTGMTIGTPQYMSPEQCQAIEIDERSDLYALGMVMYRTIAGTYPYEAKNPIQWLGAHIHGTPTGIRAYADVDDGLEHVIIKALAKTPEDRYASAAAMLEDLTAWENRYRPEAWKDTEPEVTQEQGSLPTGDQRSAPSPVSTATRPFSSQARRPSQAAPAVGARGAVGGEASTAPSAPALEAQGAIDTELHTLATAGRRTGGGMSGFPFGMSGADLVVGVLVLVVGFVIALAATTGLSSNIWGWLADVPDVNEEVLEPRSDVDTAGADEEVDTGPTGDADATEVPDVDAAETETFVPDSDVDGPEHVAANPDPCGLPKLSKGWCRKCSQAWTLQRFSRDWCACKSATGGLSECSEGWKKCNPVEAKDCP